MSISRVNESNERRKGVSKLLVCRDAVGSNEEKDGVSENADEGSGDGDIDGKTEGTLEVARWQLQRHFGGCLRWFR